MTVEGDNKDNPSSAAPLLVNIDRNKVAELVGDAAWGATLDLALAQVLVSQKDMVGASARLSAARSGLGNNADPFQARLIARIAKAIEESL